MTGALPMPPGPLKRTSSIAVSGGRSATDSAEIAARLMLLGPGRAPDGVAVAHVLLAGPELLAKHAAATMQVPQQETATALAALAAEIAPRARLRVAEAIALRCVWLGVRRVFAYVGTSELALVSAFGSLAAGTLVNARGDGEAVFMAGGGNLPGRQPEGLAVLHGARGLTNAAGAIGDLRRNEVPAVILIGLPSTRSAGFLPPHGEDGLLEAIGNFARADHQLAWPHNSSEPLDVVPLLDLAFQEATTAPCGPVLVGVPQDLLETDAAVAAHLARPRPVAEALEPAPRGLRRARRLAAGAKRPLILVDDYLLHRAGGLEALNALAARLGAPVFQVRARRGPMLFHQLTTATCPRLVGCYEPTLPEHRQQMAAADLLVTIEDRNFTPRVVGELPACPKIAITSHPDKTRRNGYLGSRDVLLAGDPVEVLNQLAPAHGPAPTVVPTREARTRSRFAPQPIRPVPTSPREQMQGTLGALVHACLELVGARWVIDDSQITGGLLAGVYEDTFGSTPVFGDHGAFIGAGAPLATGLAITRHEPVLCLLGDQGFTNGAQALVAAAEQAAPVLFLVANNGESVSLRTQADELGLPGSPDFDRLLYNPPEYSYTAAAWAYGVPAVLLQLDPDHLLATPTNMASIVDQVRALWAQPGPALVEIELPGTGPAWAGVWATRGLDEPAPAEPPQRSHLERTARAPRESQDDERLRPHPLHRISPGPRRPPRA